MISRIAIEVAAFILFVCGVSLIGYFIGYTVATDNAKKNLATFLLKKEIDRSRQTIHHPPTNKTKSKHKFHVFTNDGPSK